MAQKFGKPAAPMPKAADKRADAKQGIKEGSKRDIRDDKKGK